MSRNLTLGLTLCLLALFGCGGPEVAPSCLEAGQACGEGEVCVQGLCRVVECTDSIECAFSEHCDLDTFTCVDGCEVDLDCMAAEVCESSVCVTAMCEETHLDCPIGSFCETDSGLCFEDGYWCNSCDSNTDCEQGFQCIGSSTAAFCYTRCESNDDCPAGFGCSVIPFTDGSTQQLCYSDCELLTDNGLY